MTTIKELSNLRGRRALITGATGGLGRVMADTLAELGAELVLVDKPTADFTALTAQLVQSWGAKVETRGCDLQLQEQRSELMEWIKGSSAGLSILINNAAFVGTSELKGWGVPFEEQTIDTWRRAIEVNLTSAFHLCQGLAPLLRTSPGASIINIGSIYGTLGPDWSLYDGTAMGNPAAYAASKGGLIQLTRWLATTVAPAVRVNAVSPGGIFRNQPTSFVEKYEKGTPLGRMAQEDDFKGVIAFLATDMSGYVTGQNLVVDGGRSVW